MVDEGVLSWGDATRAQLDEFEYKKYVARTIVQSLLLDFPEENREVIDEFI